MNILKENRPIVKNTEKGNYCYEISKQSSFYEEIYCHILELCKLYESCKLTDSRIVKVSFEFDKCGTLICLEVDYGNIR